MTDIKPLHILTDNFEIIDELKKLPKLPFTPFNGATVLEQIDKHNGEDFGFIFPFERVFYVIYKYGNSVDPGLFLIKCRFENSKYLGSYFNKVDNIVFPNQQIFNHLVNQFAFYCRNFSLNI